MIIIFQIIRHDLSINLISFITNGNGVKIAVPLKYLGNFWRSLEMPLINCKVELSLTWNEIGSYLATMVIQFLQ